MRPYSFHIWHQVVKHSLSMGLRPMVIVVNLCYLAKFVVSETYPVFVHGIEDLNSSPLKFLNILHVVKVELKTLSWIVPLSDGLDLVRLLNIHRLRRWLEFSHQICRVDRLPMVS
jgi:hypothetical protein